MLLFEVLADEVESDRAVRNSEKEGILSAIVDLLGGAWVVVCRLEEGFQVLMRVLSVCVCVCVRGVVWKCGNRVDVGLLLYELRLCVIRFLIFVRFTHTRSKEDREEIHDT